MNRRDPHPQKLTPEAMSILETWLRSQEALQPPATAAPEVDQLVRYFSGALGTGTAHAVERGLTANASLRGQARQVRACLRSFQEQSWAEVACQAHGDELTAQVARAWLALAEERIRVAADVKELWLKAGLAAVRRQVAEGVTEALAAWAAFLAFGEQLKAGLRAPRMAMARGSEEALVHVTGALPEGISLALNNAENTPEGTLRVSVLLQDRQGRPSAAAEGQTVHLALLVNGEAWTIDSAAVQDCRVTWEVSQLGTVLGLSPGQLPPSYLRITFGEPEAPSSVERLSLLAEVVDAVGKPALAHPAAIDLLSEARWEAEQFRVVVAIPSLTRAGYPAHRLQLDLIISTHNRQRLGEWRISEFNDEPRTLTSPCPGCPDGTIPLSSLHARLQAPPS